MSRIKNHPKRTKTCVFCNYWLGDAGLKFVNSALGYEYEQYRKGTMCKKKL